jgi:hypothetical protein
VKQNDRDGIRRMREQPREMDVEPSELIVNGYSEIWKRIDDVFRLPPEALLEV